MFGGQDGGVQLWSEIGQELSDYVLPRNLESFPEPSDPAIALPLGGQVRMVASPVLTNLVRNALSLGRRGRWRTRAMVRTSASEQAGSCPVRRCTATIPAGGVPPIRTWTPTNELANSVFRKGSPWPEVVVHSFDAGGGPLSHHRASGSPWPATPAVSLAGSRAFRSA